METWLGIAMIAYLLVLFGLGLWSRGQVHSAEDFLVAGRRLPFSLAWATLFATWFGAGTLLAAADEVAVSGLRMTAMEPLGAGLCLVVAGLFFARPLWHGKMLTLADFYRRRFGRRTEMIFCLSVITYFSWIAAQLVGMAGILTVFFPDLFTLGSGIVIVAIVAMVYTLLGGMWSVTVTDALQVGLLIIGLLLVTWNVLTSLGGGELGAGLDAVRSAVPAEHLTVIPRGTWAELMGWVNLVAIGTLGNLCGSDLMQRVFAAKSPKVASSACIFAGGLYIAVGVMPALLGLAARALLGDGATDSVLPRLASATLTPALGVIFILALSSAVLSTIDSAMLTAASVLAHNLVRPWVPERITTLQLTRVGVLFVTVASVSLAFLGESAYALLESSYSMNLAASFVPLALGLFWRRGTERAALVSFGLGYGIWAAELVLNQLGSGLLEDTPFPVPLVAMAVSFAAYIALAMGTPREASVGDDIAGVYE